MSMSLRHIEAFKAVMENSTVNRAAEEIRTMRRGALSVGAMPALSAGFVQRVAFAFLQDRPGVKLEIRAAQRVKLMDSVASGQLDIALCNSMHEHPEIETELLSPQAAVCLLPPSHPLTQRAEISARDLKNENFVSWSEGTLTRVRVDALFDKLGIERRCGFSASTAPAICAFVANGLGVALVHPL